MATVAERRRVVNPGIVTQVFSSEAEAVEETPPRDEGKHLEPTNTTADGERLSRN